MFVLGDHLGNARIIVGKNANPLDLLVNQEKRLARRASRCLLHGKLFA